MTNQIRAAFDSIHAEESLKTGTMIYLRGEIRKRSRAQKRFPVKRFAAVLACLLVAAAGSFSYPFYFMESAYVDMDVNPALALAVNRFDRVIGTYAYNPDGEAVLAGWPVMHLDYRDAVGTVMNAMEQQGLLADGGLVSVTVQTKDKRKENAMLATIETAVLRHHGMAQVDVFVVDDATRSAAHEVNLSPAKYLAIVDLQAVDDTATVESCRNHTIGELQSLVREHQRGSHNAPAAQNGGQTAPHDNSGGHGEKGGHGKKGGHG